ncbi:MAG TPA: sugar ABC transporter permease [Clostridiales bacterium]|nr:sugar ABC transporter permease [Clostridiales bacterium]
MELSRQTNMKHAKGGYGTMLKKDFIRHKYLYLMIAPIIVYYIIFHYLPMVGNIMAFQDFSFMKGIFGSKWIGLKHFKDFLSSPYRDRVIRNTVLLNILGIIFVFPAPVILAMLLNEVKHNYYKRTIQTISYMPYFISTVVISGMIMNFTSQDGFITYIVKFITGYQGSLNLLAKPEWFRSIYVISDIWQFVGFDSIIYISAISGINPELYEAATIDGAGRWKQAIHVTLAGIAPTIIMLLILRLGSLMNVGFEKVFLLYNPAIYETSDVIATYVYRQGLEAGQYSYSTAVGLFNSVINFLFLLTANMISRRTTEISLF